MLCAIAIFVEVVIKYKFIGVTNFEIDDGIYLV